MQPPAQITLICHANNAKPAATITWLKEGAPLVHDTPVVVMTTGSTAKLTSVTSTLTLNPEKEDNGIVYTCKVEHPALSEPYQITASLNVQCK